MPLYIYDFFRKNYTRFRELKFRQKFGDSTNILSHRNIRSANYFIWYCYRRLSIMYLIVFEDRMHI